MTKISAGTSSSGSASTTALRVVSTFCGGASCPTIYQSDRGTFVVQGYSVDASSAGVDLPPGELLVEIPSELLAEAARNLP